MGSLVNQATETYNTWKVANWPSDVTAWNALTDAEKLALWSNDQMYQLAVADARLIEESFYEARSQAFSQFEATKQSEFAALQTLWQSKEDNGFDVDFGDE